MKDMKYGSSGLSHDKNRPVKGRRDGVVTGNEGAVGGPDVCYSGIPAQDGYTRKKVFPLSGSGELGKREISGGEPS
jgi:hypothetical protein